MSPEKNKTKQKRQSNKQTTKQTTTATHINTTDFYLRDQGDAEHESRAQSDIRHHQSRCVVQETGTHRRTLPKLCSIVLNNSVFSFRAALRSTGTCVFSGRNCKSTVNTSDKNAIN